MTSFGAYDAGLPCKNPSCKSYGKPHPNCRCYGNMAKGGEVYFCAKDQKHQPGCEYFAEGGAPAGIAQPPPTPELGPGDEVPSDMLPSEPGSEVPEDQLPDVAPESGSEVPSDMLPSPGDRYNRPGQGILAETEGLAQGFLGPLATAGEQALSAAGVPGLTDEDIKGRQAAFPLARSASEALGIGAGLLTGTGEAGLINKAFQVMPEAKGLMKLGAGAVQGFLTNSLIQGGDEISKAMLGQGDPEAPVAGALANMGAVGLYGLGGSVLGQGTSRGLRALSEMNLMQRVEGFLNGVGIASSSADPAIRKTITEALDKEVTGNSGFKTGLDFYDKMVSGLASGTAVSSTLIGASQGYKEHGLVGGLEGAAKGAFAGVALGILGNQAARYGSKYTVPTLLKIVSSAPAAGLSRALDYLREVSGGTDAMGAAIESLFSRGTQKLFNTKNIEENREKLREKMEQGGFDQDIQHQIYKDHESSLDDELYKKYVLGHKPEDPFSQEIPGMKGVHQGIDQFLTDNVVDPLSSAGHPDLGAGLATAGSTAAALAIPETYGDIAGVLLPFKKGMKLPEEAEKAAKTLPEMFASKLRAWHHEDEAAKYEQEISKVQTEPYQGSDIANPVWLRESPDGPKAWTSSIVAAPFYNVEAQGHLGKDLAKGGADPFAWMDTRFGAGKKALIDNADKDLKISTRSDLIAHDDYLEHLNPKKHSVEFHVFSDDPRSQRMALPGGPSFGRVVTAAEKLRDRGIKVKIVLDKVPKEMLPEGFGDLENSIDQVKLMKDHGIPSEIRPVRK